MASLLPGGNGTQSELIGTSTQMNMAQPAATSTLELFKQVLDEYDSFTRERSTKEQPLPAAKPRRQDEQILERLLRTQHEQAAQRIQALLHGEIGGPPNPSEQQIAETEIDTIWASLEADKMVMVRPTCEQGGNSWDKITQSACRGVRRIVKGLPEDSGR